MAFVKLVDETDEIEVYMPKDDWSEFPSGKIYKSKGDSTATKSPEQIIKEKLEVNTKEGFESIVLQFVKASRE